MSRNSIKIISICLISLSSGFAMAASCGDKIQGFNEYEKLENGKIVEKVSVAAVEDWFMDDPFQGIVVRSSENPKTEVEFEVFQLQKGKKVKIFKKASWKLKEWSLKKEFRVVDGLDAKKFFNAKTVGKQVVFRLKLSGKVLCEDAPRRISNED